MRLLVIFFDGLGDRPAAELGGLTPLEAADSPGLDRFAAEGINGLLHARSPGYPLGSPLALHLLFGYPEKDFPDRGPLIARSRGVEIQDGDVIMSARFASATVDDGIATLKQRFIREREDACVELAASIASREVDGFEFTYIYGGNGDGNLLIRGGASFEVTDTDPLALDLPVLRAQARADASDRAQAERTADALNRWLTWAHEQLEGHPASGGDGEVTVNFVITKWAGPKPRLEPFQDKWGMLPASLPDEEVVTGLMDELGFRICQVEDSDPEADLRQRLAVAKDLLAEGYEFIHLHTKYPDPVSHENRPDLARDEIEGLGAGMQFYWDELADDENLVTVLTTDHTTPSVWTGNPRGVFNDQHGGEPGPIAIRGGNVRVDSVTEFGERAAASGGLGLLRGEDFMPVLLNAAERTNMYEMRPTPVHRLYRPRLDDLDPLRL